MAEPAAIRRYAAIRRQENAIEAGAADALRFLLNHIREQLVADGMDPAALDSRHPQWSVVVERDILPPVTEAFLAGLRREAGEGTVDAVAYAARHLEQVRNRLVGVADSTFDDIRAVIRDGWLAGDDIPTLTRSVDAALGDADRWKNRARTIARTEAIGANNAGAREAARYQSAVLGIEEAAVAKEWLATPGPRTRPTHSTASGQTVIGVDTPFSVGSALLQQPGEPGGPAEEVINCRCTVLYHFPGDPGYPADAPPYVVTPPDPATLPVEAIDSELADLIAIGDFGPRFAALSDELDRRDNYTPTEVEVPATPDPLAEQRALNEVLYGAEVPDLPAGGVERRYSTIKRDPEKELRDEYDTWVYTQWLRAEEDTKGNMLNDRALAEGVDVVDLFTGRKRNLARYVTPELQEWFAQPGNRRMSFPEFRAGLRNDRSAREARSRLRNRGYESEWG